MCKYGHGWVEDLETTEHLHITCQTFRKKMYFVTNEALYYCAREFFHFRINDFPNKTSNELS